MVATLIVLCILCAAACALVGAAYVRELHRLTRFLRGSLIESNERPDVGAPLPGCADLVAALDARLEADKAQDRERVLEARRFQEDLASLSHDIRTPLAGAKGYVQLAADEADPAERAACLDAAVQRMDAMQGLLDQLFAYTRSMDAEALGELEDVDALSVLAQALAGACPQFEEQGRTMDVQLDDPQLIVLADADALRRVLDNVIRNAAEHGVGVLKVTQQGSALTFANEMPKGAHVDEGLLFQRFYQADASRGQGNAGLGLATVKNLCTAMGIHVSATSSSGSFTLQLRLQDPAPQT